MIDEAAPIIWQLLGGAFEAAGPHAKGRWLAPLDTPAYEQWAYAGRAVQPLTLLGGQLDVFTKTSPATLLSCLLPFCLWCLACGSAAPHPGLCAALGLLLWSLLEYGFHSSRPRAAQRPGRGRERTGGKSRRRVSMG
jgi:hypothetical protein